MLHYVVISAPDSHVLEDKVNELYSDIKRMNSKIISESPIIIGNYDKESEKTKRIMKSMMFFKEIIYEE